MKCRRCSGRLFLDRVFSDNKNFETSCLLCGDRRYVSKESEFGKWLTRMENKKRMADVL